jgi:hypothetical protein
MLIEIVCFVVFAGVLVLFWGAEENILEKKNDVLPKDESKTLQNENKSIQHDAQDSVTFEVNELQNHAISTLESAEFIQEIEPEKQDNKPKYIYLDALLEQELNPKNVLVQKKRLMHIGQVTPKYKNAGVYAIFSAHNNRIYVGSSANLFVRMRQHLFELKHKRHHSYRLQEDFDKYGEDNFSFWVLESM